MSNEAQLRALHSLLAKSGLSFHQRQALAWAVARLVLDMKERLNENQ